MTGYGSRLLARHAAMLAASGIPPEHARERGYCSIDIKRRLADFKVAQTGRRVPGLLIPLLRADGSTWGYQYRPDDPRMTKTGRAVKYETPRGQRNGLDVPPGVGGKLGDPSIPLWITGEARRPTQRPCAAWPASLSPASGPGAAPTKTAAGPL